MRSIDTILDRRWHHRVAIATVVVSHLISTVGLPVPASHGVTRKDGEISFPCQDRPCGCLTAERCWAGACCCFSMREKVAWANEHSLQLPARAYRLAEEEAELEAVCADKLSCSHCKDKSPSPVRWMIPTLSGTCGGHHADSLSLVVPVLIPPNAICAVDCPAFSDSQVMVHALPYDSRPFDPPTPPPRVS